MNACGNVRADKCVSRVGKASKYGCERGVYTLALWTKGTLKQTATNRSEQTVRQDSKKTTDLRFYVLHVVLRLTICGDEKLRKRKTIDLG